MRNALVVAVIEGMQDLFENLGRVFLREELVLDDAIKQLTASANLSDEVHVFIVIEVLVQLEHVWMIKLLQNEDLLLEPVHVLDLLLGDLFDCTLLLGLSMHT